MKKMLLVLNAENPLHRLLRRGIVIGVFTLLSIIFRGLIIGEAGPILPEWTVPLFTAILAIIDKGIREATEEPR